MKNKNRNMILIILCVIATIFFAIADISSYGKLTNEFLGMIIVLLGSIIVPSVVELVKENKK